MGGDASTTSLVVTVVSALKEMNATSCPYTLSDFGGAAHYASHWTHLLAYTGGSGGCFLRTGRLNGAAVLVP